MAKWMLNLSSDHEESMILTEKRLSKKLDNLFIILWWSWWGIYPTTFLNAIQGAGFIT
tara:strand:+ start:14044 stop:14217 length:174 start_codon:yes stop_codon:yes gene_type:complete